MFLAILFDFDGTLVDFVAADIQSLKWLHSRAHSGKCAYDAGHIKQPNGFQIAALGAFY